jgi:hypothetical protein
VRTLPKSPYSFVTNYQVKSLFQESYRRASETPPILRLAICVAAETFVSKIGVSRALPQWPKMKEMLVLNGGTHDLDV